MKMQDLAPQGDVGDDLDFGPLPRYVGFQLRRAQSWVFDRFGRELGDLELTPGAFGLLTLIHRNPGITQMQLARAFGIDKSTLSPVLARLEKRGFVLREAMERDRRFNVLRIAPGAQPQIERMLMRLEAFETRLSVQLGPKGAIQLLALLTALRAESND